MFNRIFRGTVISTTDENQSIIYADISMYLASKAFFFLFLVLTSGLDLEFVQQVRDQIPVLKQKRNDLYEVKETKH